MIVLDSATTVLQGVLAGAVAANQPEAVVQYYYENSEGVPTKKAAKRIALNSTTDVTICPAPPQGYITIISNLTVYNKDTATVTVTIKTDNGTTEYIIVKQALLTTKTLVYEDKAGWQII